MAVASLPVRRFSADDLMRMVDAGILREDDRVELIDGRVVEMSPIGDEHVAATMRLPRLFDRRFGDSVVLSVQNPISLTPFDEPQPDIAVLRPKASAYRGKPRTEDVLLLIEVADSSLVYDLGDKAAQYAAAGIGELWVLDLVHRQVLVHREPGPQGYGSVSTHSSGQSLAPLFAPAEMFPVGDLLD